MSAELNSSTTHLPLRRGVFLGSLCPFLVRGRQLLVILRKPEMGVNDAPWLQTACSYPQSVASTATQPMVAIIIRV